MGIAVLEVLRYFGGIVSIGSIVSCIYAILITEEATTNIYLDKSILMEL